MSKRMRFVGLTLALAVALVVLPLAAARSGDLDPTFGDGGKVVSDLGPASRNSLAVQRDGRIVVATYGDPPRLVRLLANGHPDASFGNGGTVVTVGVRVALLTGGKIVVGGSPDASDVVVARHRRDGRLDSTFGERGIVTTDVGGTEFVTNVVGVRGRKIVAFAGSLPENAPDEFAEARIAVVRYLADGRLDDSFGSGGRFVGLPGVLLVAGALAPGGKVVVVGARVGENAFTQLVVARLTARGRLDRSFSRDGIANLSREGHLTPVPTAVALAPDGKIVVVGARVRGSVYGVIRLRADGTRDPAFGAGIPNHGSPYDLLAARLDAQGRIVIAGTIIGKDIVVMRLTRRGRFDERFGDGGAVTTDFGDNDVPLAIAIQRDGKIVAAGWTGASFNEQDRHLALARYRP